jgi:hypothetical protein
LVSNGVNRGQGHTVRHGILEARGAWILVTDADLSAPIEELDTLLAAARSRHAAVVFGSRPLDPSLIELEQSLARRAAGRSFNLLLRLLTRLRFKDTSTSSSSSVPTPAAPSAGASGSHAGASTSSSSTWRGGSVSAPSKWQSIGLMPRARRSTWCATASTCSPTSCASAGTS